MATSGCGIGSSKSRRAVMEYRFEHRVLDDTSERDGFSLFCLFVCFGGFVLVFFFFSFQVVIK